MNPLNSIILLKKQMGMSEAFYLINPATEVFFNREKAVSVKQNLKHLDLEQHLTERWQNYVTRSQHHYWVISVQPHCIFQVWPVALLPTHGTSQCVSQGEMQVWECPAHDILPILMNLLGIESWRKSCKIFLLFMSEQNNQKQETPFIFYSL